MGEGQTVLRKKELKKSFITNNLSISPDVDECGSQETNVCHSNASCSNTDGSYDCSCLPGFSGNGFDCTSKYFNYHAHRHSEIQGVLFTRTVQSIA